MMGNERLDFARAANGFQVVRHKNASRQVISVTKHTPQQNNVDSKVGYCAIIGLLAARQPVTWVTKNEKMLRDYF
jgi:hypothetical protein